MKKLVTEKAIDVRFSEVDVMTAVWNGSYPLYLEDAREAFGEEWGLSYKGYLDNKVYAPIVKMDIRYKNPIFYAKHKPHIRITYRYTEAAKVIFDYEIFNPEDGTIFVTATTIQVFMDMDYQLILDNPPFYEEWKKKWRDADDK